jgi:uncharacterized membrane protein YdjX (TVP38/TMEM64 family)
VSGATGATASWTKARLGLGLLLAAGMVVGLFQLEGPNPVRVVELSVQALRGSGVLGVVVFMLIYVAATLLLFPGSVVTTIAGLVYGPWLGTAIVSPASVTAAFLAAVLGRTVARQGLERRAVRYPWFRAMDEAISAEGGKIVFLLRLSPLIPFPLLNYLLGITRISHGRNVLFSALAMLPGTFAYVSLGAALGDVTKVFGDGAHRRTPLTTTVLWIGLAASLLLAITLTRLARRALARSIEERRAAPACPPNSRTSSASNGQVSRV